MTVGGAAMTVSMTALHSLDSGLRRNDGAYGHTLWIPAFAGMTAAGGAGMTVNVTALPGFRLAPEWRLGEPE